MIKIITAIDTFPVRHPVLREGKPLDTCHFEGDNSENTIHFGYYVDEILVGVVTLSKESNSLYDYNHQYRVRGMAVLDSFRKRNIGKKLIEHCESFVIENNGEIIWFNARKIALDFYKKVGYEIYGDGFEIADIGLHFVMFKTF